MPTEMNGLTIDEHNSTQLIDVNKSERHLTKPCNKNIHSSQKQVYFCHNRNQEKIMQNNERSVHHQLLYQSSKS